MKGKINISGLCVAFLILIIISVPLTSFLGSASLSFDDIVKVYRFKLFNDGGEAIEKSLINIVWGLRLPRAILAICVGAGLSICGSVMQALTKNVMAEPYTLGVASGASVMAAICIGFLDSGVLSVSVGAFIGALTAMMIVYNISKSSYGSTGTKLILTGIGVSMICGALVQLIISVVSNPARLKGIVFWGMGSLGGARWENIIIPIISLVSGMIVIYLNAERLNVLAMGNQTALTLGINVKGTQRLLIFTISLITGVMVAVGGTIGFVGLVVPHVVRSFVGADNRKNFFVIALTGSLFLLWMDAFSRYIFAPREVPIGVLTALVGGPFFVYLMKKGGGRL